jgi:hypothetical protein
MLMTEGKKCGIIPAGLYPPLVKKRGNVLNRVL